MSATRRRRRVGGKPRVLRGPSAEGSKEVENRRARFTVSFEGSVPAAQERVDCAGLAWLSVPGRGGEEDKRRRKRSPNPRWRPDSDLAAVTGYRRTHPRRVEHHARLQPPKIAANYRAQPPRPSPSAARPTPKRWRRPGCMPATDQSGARPCLAQLPPYASHRVISRTPSFTAASITSGTEQAIVLYSAARCDATANTLQLWRCAGQLARGAAGASQRASQRNNALSDYYY